MARRSMTPGQWRKLPRSERVEMLAYEYRQQERADKIISQITEAMPSEIGMLAQVIALLNN